MVNVDLDEVDLPWLLKVVEEHKDEYAALNIIEKLQQAIQQNIKNEGV